MNDCIERKKAIELIQPHVKPQTVYGKGYLQAIEHATDILELMPAADVQPVKRGKWEKKKGYLVCSNCGMTVDTIGYTYEEQEEVFRYCSCCGYRMDGEQNENN